MSSEKTALGLHKWVGTDSPKREEFNENFGKLESHLAEKANESEVRKRAVKLELEDMSENTLAAIQGGEGTTFNLLSVPQDNSVTIKKVTKTAQSQIAIKAFKVADESVINMLSDVNNGTLQPSNLERIAAENDGVDGIIFEYVPNDDTYPLDVEDVPFRIKHTYQRPTTSQYSRSTFTFGFDAPIETDKDLYFSLLLKRSSVEAMSFQARFQVRVYQSNSVGTTVVDTDLNFSRDSMLIEGTESTATSNGKIGYAKILKVTPDWIAVGVKQIGGLHSGVNSLRVRLGVYGLPVSPTVKTMEYYNFVHSNQVNDYIDPFLHAPSSLKNLYGDRLINIIQAGNGNGQDEFNFKPINKKFINQEFFEDEILFSTFKSNEWVGGTTEQNINVAGVESKRLTSSNLAFVALDKTGFILDGTDMNFHLRVFIENADNLTDIELRFCVDGDWNKRFIQIWSRVSGSEQYLQNGWNDLTGNINSMSIIGVTEADLSRISSARIRVRAKVDVTSSVVFDVLNFRKNPMSEGIVTITFDDGYRSLVTEALPYMSQYGFKGVAYVFPSAIGAQPHFCTLEQLKILERAGWDVSNHTFNHLNLTTISPEETENQLTSAIKWFKDNGFKRGIEHFSYPQGGNDSVSREIVKKYFKTGRISSGSGSFPNARYNAFPLINEYQIQVIGIYQSTLMEDVYKAIDNAKKNKTWAVLMYHGLLPDEGVTMDINLFKQQMDYLYNSGVRVATLSEIT